MPRKARAGFFMTQIESANRKLPLNFLKVQFCWDSSGNVAAAPHTEVAIRANTYLVTYFTHFKDRVSVQTRRSRMRKRE